MKFVAVGLSVAALAIASSALAEIHSLEFVGNRGAFRAVGGVADSWRTAGPGLWRLNFKSGASICSEDFTNAEWSVTREGDLFVFDCPLAMVRVGFKENALSSVDIRGEVTAKTEDAALELELPAKLEFRTDDVDTFHMSERGKHGPGFAFNRKFFERSLVYFCEYPNLFMDFCQLDTVSGGRLALYGVRPRPAHEPWKAERAFVPGSLRVAGTGSTGYVRHVFKVYAEKGGKFVTPSVRLATGRDVRQSVEDYALANDITRKLEDKAPAEVLNKLKRSPLVLAYGRASQIAEECAAVPSPTLFHHHRYLKGGFDKEYPDHLPSNAEKFGTDEEHRAMIDTLHAAGHLYSPYSNPTWWCDHPRGPTFERVGDVALLVGADGKHIYEKYKNDGWTTCLWHPEVRAANRRTIDAFTSQLPVDVLFQDQVGARRCPLDFNPAAPSPLAYTEGMLSMAEEDALRVPLATEDGWDKVANQETVICGCAWQIVPHTLDTNTWMSVLDRKTLPADTWVYEPLTLYMMHDKCIFYLHNLSGMSNNDRILVWQLALGYNLSLAMHFPGCTKSVNGGPAREWYKYLHDLQTRVLSKVAGRKLTSFVHDRSQMLSREGFDKRSGLDDGTIEAEWDGGVRVLANLGNVRRKVKGVWLAPYGYQIIGPGFEAAYLLDREPFIEDEAGRSEYHLPFEYVSAKRPDDWEDWKKLRVFVESSKDHSFQPGFAWFPEESKTNNVPLLVALHSWSFGYDCLDPATWALKEAKKRGWGFYYPHFRGPNKTPQGCGSDLAVQDIYDGVRNMCRRAKIDENRVYLLGGSGGGHMALLMAGRRPELFAAVYAACPITDVGRWHDESMDPNLDLFKKYAEMLEQVCGGPYSARREEYNRRSPVTYLGNSKTKNLAVDIITGIHDGHRRPKDGGSVPCGHAIRGFNCIAAEADRIPEEVIAEIERTEKVPEEYAFTGTDPFFVVPRREIYLRRVSGNARITLFNAGHSGNYAAAAEWFTRQRRGQAADWSTAGGAVAREPIGEITK